MVISTSTIGANSPWTYTIPATQSEPVEQTQDEEEEE